MASFRLVFPDGSDAAITDRCEISLSEDARVVIEVSGTTYRLHNDGSRSVQLLCEKGTAELQPDATQQLTTDCRLHLAGEKTTTEHSIEATGRIKRRRTEGTTKRQMSLGFHLYRLRHHACHSDIDGDLASWFRGEVQYACLSNYLVDLFWLLSAVPSMTSIPELLLIHGERYSDGHLRDAIEKHGLHQMVLHKAPLPIPYGTHHSKACLIKFATGMRVVIHTANLIYVDCGNKTQGAWIQDFPKKRVHSSSTSPFEKDLLDYFDAVQLPAPQKTKLFQYIQEHDYSNARVKLIASVPGYHRGDDIERYGHMSLRKCLEQESFSNAFKRSPIVCQFSSLGSLDEKWLYGEFMDSLSAGSTEDGNETLETPSADDRGLQLIWPTTEQVRTSVEGWAAGVSLPGSAKNIQKTFIERHWHKFDGTHVMRERAMPHIKTYTRYADSQLAWVLLTSHNLSKAAWGVLQKKDTQFMVRSYELGVLFLPSLERKYWQSPFCGFSCTHLATTASTLPKEIAFVRYSDEKNEENADSEPSLSVEFCLPYQLPPQPYTPSDTPWAIDVRMPGLDCLGQSWGTHAALYGCMETTDVTI